MTIVHEREAPTRAENSETHRTVDRSILTSLACGYCVLSIGLNSVVAMSEVRREITMSDTVTSLHGSFFGWGMIGLSLGAALVARLFSRTTMFIVGIGFVASGALLFSFATRPLMSLTGAFGFGLGSAAIVLVIPAAVSSRFPHRRGVLLTRLNVAPTVAGLILPIAFVIGGSQGWSWRTPIRIVIPIAVLVTLWFAVPAARQRLFDDPSNDIPPLPYGPIGGPVGSAAHVSIWTLLRIAPIRRRWIIQLVQISAEFAFGTWTVVYLREVGGVSSSVAPLGPVVWAIGMTISRFLTPQLIRRAKNRLEVACFGTAFFGSASLLGFHSAVPMLCAIFVAAVGFGLMYTLGVDRLFINAHAAAVTDDHSISALAALASGVAISIGPLTVGALSDQFGLRRAMLFSPVIALVCLAFAVSRRRREAGSLGSLRSQPHP